MKLCTFEVTTHIGRCFRVGALHDGFILDLNFACAWYLAQQGEPEPQVLANAWVPASMVEFLRAGLRAMHAARELFLDSGPQPPQWWRSNPPPRGLNDETLAHRAQDVRLCAPVPNPARVGPGEEVSFEEEPEYEMKLAAVIGKRGTDIKSFEADQYIAGYTAMNDFGGHSALGPYLVTADEILNPYSLEALARVNGECVGHTYTTPLRPKFEQAIESLSHGNIILPGDLIALSLDLPTKVKRGDVVELQIDTIGTLRTPLV